MKNFEYKTTTAGNGVVITGYKGIDGIVNIPSEIEGKPVTHISSYTFYLAGLISVTIPDSVTNIGIHAFDGCDRLKKISVNANNTKYSSINGVLFNKNKTKLICYPMGRDDVSYVVPNSVTSIGSYAFYCSCPMKLYITDNVTSIGMGAFNGNNNSYHSRHIYYEGREQQWYKCIVDKNDEWITDAGVHIHYKYSNYIYSVMAGNVTITNYTGTDIAISIPSEIDGKPVTAIGSCAFEDCKSLTHITIPDSITSIGANAFSYCSSLKSIAIPDSITNIGSHAFYRCTGLISITIPDSVTSIGDYAFYECTSLTSAFISDGVTSIDNYTFCYCTRLTTIDIPNGVTSIGSYAFNGCTNLTSVIIPDTVKFIGKGAFYGCDALKNVVIPNSVKYIGDYAFYYCTGMTGALNHSLFLGRGNEHLKK